MTTPSAASPPLADTAAPALAPGRAGGVERSRRPLAAGLLMLVPAVAELVVGGYQLGGASLWRDEGDTLSAATRPVAGILALMHHEDAVHGVYYLLMHFVVSVAGPSATALRLPSLLATSAAAAMTAVLGRRLTAAAGLPAPGLTGMAAGLLLVALPITTFYAEDARPYALATLLALVATYLLVRGWQDPRPRWWAGYGLTLLLLATMNLLALLIIVPHAVTLLAVRRGHGEQGGAWRARLGWLVASAAAIACASPLIALAQGQTTQISWIHRPHAAAIVTLLGEFSGTAQLIPVVAGLAGLCALGWLVRGSGSGQPGSPAQQGTGCTVVKVALPWLVLPPAILLAVSQVHPVYDDRYVLFCSPAMALLAAGGLATLAGLVAPAVAGLPGRLRHWLPAVAPAVLAAVIVGLVAVPQQQIRLTSARPDNLRAVAAVIAAQARPGDAVLYLPWAAKVVSEAYPAPFSRLRDIALGVSPAASATLRGTLASDAELFRRFASVTRLWTVGLGVNRPTNSRLGRAEARLLAQLSLVRTWRIRTVTLSLYVRR